MGAQPILCRTPAPGRKPTRIDPWTFVRIRGLILAVLGAQPQGVVLDGLPALVRRQIGEAEATELEPLDEIVPVVRSELEVRGEIRQQVAGSTTLIIAASHPRESQRPDSG